ncbi:uncharacterized protein LOC133912884 isoform X1 [Phragmites australis]|uniref:uncharacterized protein LOC133912884 isoform X1 n=1 Tax=Phragmites australis TaxID=29695 RepID=UPI002D790923|nr:uncharacterized protein LOC133912884 isoform X1 [Phragmites australis]XP_062211827.1 uncharacterized protein LOC133912884 isoform X1 [Phragmites australis]
MLQKQEWVKTQDMLKSKLILGDDFDWSFPSMGSNSENNHSRGKLKYISGVDISFLKEDPSIASVTVVVLEADTFLLSEKYCTLYSFFWTQIRLVCQGSVVLVCQDDWSIVCLAGYR